MEENTMKNWRAYRNYGVYLVTDRELCLGRPLDEVVLAAVRGGAGAVQLREKHADSREFLALARALVSRLQPMGIPLIVNDRADIALAAGAAGLHVGQSDLPPEDARRLMGENAIIGLSVETREELLAAEKLDIDYVGISPVFATPTKTDTLAPWGLDGLRWAREHSPPHAGGHRRHSQGKRRRRAGGRCPQPCRGVGNMLRRQPGRGGARPEGPFPLDPLLHRTAALCPGMPPEQAEP